MGYTHQIQSCIDTLSTTQRFSIYDLKKIYKSRTTKDWFYYEDIITYNERQKTILNLQNNSKVIYIIQNEYNNYLITGQSIWNQYLTQIP